jgi:hypothetical protein
VKRLPEPYDVTDPNEEYASTLLKHTGPLEPSAMRKRRVWMALERSAMKRSRIRVSGPAIAALVLLGATAASATMPRLWRRLQATPAPSEIAAVDSVEARPAHRRPMKTPPAPLVPTAAAETPSTALVASDPAADPVETSAPLAHAANPSSGKKVAPSTKARAAAEAVDPPAGAALMVEAMRERRAGNLAHARELSAEYRLKYPAGALQEEAFALSIEAAAALGDDEARRIAATYLQRYPRGRFRAQAERALGSSR